MAGHAITLALPDHPRCRALIDGTVRPQGLELNCSWQWRSVGERHGKVLAGEFDAGEISTSTWLRARSFRQKPGLVGLPVFMYRGFRHRTVLTRRQGGISSLRQLAGKRVGITRYTATSIVWTRGLLHEEYGVAPETVRWVVAEPELVEMSRPVPLERLHADRRELLAMLRRGELDAVIFPGNDDYHSIYGGGRMDHLDPDLDLDRLADLREVVEDPAEVLDYHRRTGIYPLIHTVVLQESLLERDPQAAASLLEAFRQARREAGRYMNEREKWKEAREIEALGGDPYAYELGEDEQKAMRALIRYLERDGLLGNGIKIDGIFVS